MYANVYKCLGLSSTYINCPYIFLGLKKKNVVFEILTIWL